MDFIIECCRNLLRNIYIYLCHKGCEIFFFGGLIITIVYKRMWMSEWVYQFRACILIELIFFLSVRLCLCLSAKYFNITLLLCLSNWIARLDGLVWMSEEILRMRSNQLEMSERWGEKQKTKPKHTQNPYTQLWNELICQPCISSRNLLVSFRDVYQTLFIFVLSTLDRYVYPENDHHFHFKHNL